MIKIIDTPSQFDGYNKTDIYSIRILSLLKAYGTKYDFAVFYRQINDAGELTAIISKLDNDCTLSANKNADFDELKEFFLTLGYNSVLGDDRLFLTDKYDSGAVMVTKRKAELHKSYCEIDCYPKLMDIFNIDDYEKADFESWYVDLSHRIRHGCSKAYTLNSGGEIISSGIFSSLYNDDGILTSVRTVPEYRNMGYGSVLVSEMICDIKGNVYLMREQNKNESFYTKLGFENIGTWRMFK
ncbi:MAG: GNAT family N-acetyltransferase [Eubacteriales bacterium]|nr:GNAT family N-acetyltransferase [Eubacteriales bacterium]